MTEISTSEGVLRDTESTIINNVLSFEKKVVRDIMTPRSVTFMLDEDMSVKDYMSQPEFKTFSRVPIYAGEKDHVTGLILKDDALDAMARENTEVKLKELRREIPAITDDMKLPELLKRTSKDRKHMHLVTDDFGHVLGVVTMEDIFETLLGAEIVDESDVVVDLQAHAKEKWEKKNTAEE
jgi:CBS domain containing-hemolysin-like protein